MDSNEVCGYLRYLCLSFECEFSDSTGEGILFHFVYLLFCSYLSSHHPVNANVYTGPCRIMKW